MNLNPVVLAIPIFFTLILIELIVEYVSRRHTYRLNDALTNINTGVLSQVSGAFVKVLTVGVYAFLYEHWAIVRLPQNIWTFAALFLLYDLCYYLYHRASHTVSLFWGGHSVHHQSEEYNLSVALRQSSTDVAWSFMFYLPLAVAGFAPEQLVLVGGLNLLYQFWIHTEHIGKMGWLVEAVMNTPSHHRVHHARDPKYIDKNYAGVFIIWDRMFGTFKAEEERPNYGITTPLDSWNPVYANFSHYLHLFALLPKARHWRDALRMLFNKPGWQPDYLGGYQAPKSVAAGYRKYDRRAALPMQYYIFGQFLLLLLATSLYLFNLAQLGTAAKLALSLWVVWSTFAFGFLMEKRPFAPWVEVPRLVATAVLPFALGLPATLAWAALALVLLSALALPWALRKHE